MYMYFNIIILTSSSKYSTVLLHRKYKYKKCLHYQKTTITGGLINLESQLNNNNREIEILLQINTCNKYNNQLFLTICSNIDNKFR